MTRHDPSLSEHSLFGSITWVAMTLGMTRDTFQKRRPMLESEGFPVRDALTNLFIKADVCAWVTKRRRVSDTEAPSPEREKPKTGVNTDAL
jgi:hypothetical protein